ncbi:saccharopine dehydrogenase NADP-binding domain-containing protein [Salinisphaera sp. T31B1]|uniref:saccharopine dehydrogenase family protein n=1 Tax=Salinisphaera sp. T31B1 TaxID=727963 RepID=UPI00333F3A79
MPANGYDIVIFGATSFVGQLVCAYLAQRYEADGDFRWAMAGRTPAKLERVRDQIGRPDIDLIVADAQDPASLTALCEQTRAVVSTVGPYALYGEPMIAACTETGTDYCDLTGEVHWIKQMLSRYEARARQTGARIVPCCGFDSLPSDLGVHFLQQAAGQRFGVPCNRVKMRVKAMRGGFSGGTVASMTALAKALRRDPSLRRELANPYSICPPGYDPGVRQPSVRAARYDDTANAWIAPFIMATTNERVVQRSNALSEQAYGRDFQYDEAMLMGRGIKGRMAAHGLTLGLGGFLLGVALAPTRAVLERFVLPAPGEGPSPEAQANGFYDIRLFGRTADGERLTARVRGDRDPGYGSTCKMLGEAGACLARDIGSEVPGGFWTPATLFGDALIERLQTHAGVSFDLVD